MTGARILDHAAVIGAGGQHGLCERRDLVGGEDGCPIRRLVDPDVPAVNEGVFIGVVDCRRAGDDSVVIVRIALGDLQCSPPAARTAVEIGKPGRLTVEGGDDRLHRDGRLAVRPVEEVHERRRIAIRPGAVRDRRRKSADRDRSARPLRPNPGEHLCPRPAPLSGPDQGAGRGHGLRARSAESRHRGDRRIYPRRTEQLRSQGHTDRGGHDFRLCRVPNDMRCSFSNVARPGCAAPPQAPAPPAPEGPRSPAQRNRHSQGPP